MKNIEINKSTCTYKDERATEQTVRFSATFDDEVKALAFTMDLIQCIAKFQVATKE